jgi:hypothetical protein
VHRLAKRHHALTSHNAFFLDSDVVNFPASATGLKLFELSPNVQFATGAATTAYYFAKRSPRYHRRADQRMAIALDD